jgi:dienelactone hydrolase
MQIYMWYPAADSCPASLTWGHVVEWVGVEASHTALDSMHADAGRNEFVAWMSSLGADSAAARSALKTPLHACAGSTPQPGRHPLVLLAVGKDGSPIMHATLAEELARRGWVVLSSPGLGARERPMTFAPQDIEAQVEDLKALARHAASLDFVEASSPVLVGFSYGVGSALIYAMADTTVAAVVSLDGSIGFADRASAYTAASGWRPDRIRAPVLHLRAPDDERKDLTALESLATRPRVETIEGSTHFDFTTLGPVSANGLSVPAIDLDDSDGDEIHEAILAATVMFLEEHRPPADRD